MAYTPRKDWVDGVTPILAVDLDAIEAGLVTAAAEADQALAGLATKADLVAGKVPVEQLPALVPSVSPSTPLTDFPDGLTRDAELTGTYSLVEDLNDEAVLRAQADTEHVADPNDPHAAAKYAIMPDGGRRIFVRATEPVSGTPDFAVDGDVWINTA